MNGVIIILSVNQFQHKFSWFAIFILDKKGFTMFTFTKIVNEEQAKQFIEFATKKFSTIQQLIEWLKPIRDELGIVEQKEFSITLHKKNQLQKTDYVIPRKQKKHIDYLMLNFDNKGTIILIGYIYESCQDNIILGKVDFSESQHYCKNFIDLKIKIDQYHDAVKQAQQIYDEVIPSL